MTRTLFATIIIGLAVATPALSQGNGNNARGNGGANIAANPSNGGCPPGLAKKNPPCVPPGLARNRGYDVGDRYDGDLIFVDRNRYGLPPLRDGEGYVRVGDRILRLDRDQRLVLDIVDTILN